MEKVASKEAGRWGPVDTGGRAKAGWPCPRICRLSKDCGLCLSGIGVTGGF